MKEAKTIKDSFNEVKILKPKPKRLCPKRKNHKNFSPLSSSTSNSERSQFQFEMEESKMKLTNFDNISLEEIENDFLIYEEYLEEKECQNELWNILNNNSEKNFSELNIRNNSRIKRCRNKFNENNYEYLNECNIDDLFNELVSEKVEKCDDFNNNNL